MLHTYSKGRLPGLQIVFGFVCFPRWAPITKCAEMNSTRLLLGSRWRNTQVKRHRYCHELRHFVNILVPRTPSKASVVRFEERSWSTRSKKLQWVRVPASNSTRTSTGTSTQTRNDRLMNTIQEPPLTWNYNHHHYRYYDPTDSDRLQTM